MNPVLITTGDGSHSLHVPELSESYHSTHGALRESLHVFLRAGFEFVPESQMVRVLEVGMGTGLNALLTVKAASQRSGATHYTALEAYPLPESIVSLLNYPELVGDMHAADWFESIHSAPWDAETNITEFFVLRKLKGRMQDMTLSPGFDVVYFDAFAPQKQPEMWTQEIFHKIFGVMTGGGVLVTYCAKGQVKRDLRAVGFEVESLAGPPGKREMIRARRPNQSDQK